MEKNDIRQLAALMKEMGLTALEYTNGAESVKLERGVSAAATGAPIQAAAVEPAQEAAGDTYTVKSPMVGVFYAAPAADKKPYVSLGDRVEAGDTLCIIEAMKMMNEITAERGGTVVEICVGNKQIVEYGHPLFRLSLD